MPAPTKKSPSKSTRKPRAKKRQTRQKKSRWWAVLWFWLRWPIVFGCIALLLWTLWLDITVREKFDGRKWAMPAKVYAQPLELYQGLRLSEADLVYELEALGYRGKASAAAAGQFSRNGARFLIYTRGFDFSDGREPSRSIEVRLEGGYVSSLRQANGQSLPLQRLEPVEIGGIYPGHKEDRLLVRLEDIPPLLGEGLIAIEDRNFLDHYGLSFSSIARAAFANLKAGGVVQGGSTLTQQLVKNFYLSQDRSFTRKAQEAIMSLLLEYHYSKREILQTYINEVYLGQNGQRAIHGFGLAAVHYFDQPLSQLNTQQVALLVGLVKGASFYNPWRHPKRATERRNLVLKVMWQSELISEAEYRKTIASPLGVVTGKRVKQKEFPSFLDLVKRQLLRDYHEEDLSSEGLRIFTSFSLRAQSRAERAVTKHLQQLEKTHSLTAQSLEAAVVSVAVGSGEVLAVVGGRRPGFEGFNRALDARRSIGSLMKPALYLTAFEQNYNLATSISDAPVTVKGPDDSLWQPRNFDLKSHDDVPLYKALSSSYNQAAARLGMQLGLDSVAETVARLGVDTDVPRVPAMVLGAVEWSPLSVASMYHTIAADGFHTPLRAILNVQTMTGQPLSRYPLAVQQKFSSADIYQLKAGLQLVMQIGSGRNAYQQLPNDLAVAGKTGTSNDQRDSWFAGFSDETLVVVWLGRDDNGVTPLTGASGALPVWASIMAADPGRGLSQSPPDGVVYHWVDEASGLASADNCQKALRLPFIAGQQPKVKAPCQWAENPLLHWWKNL